MIVVHHLNNSRSQRILWLLEELELSYDLRRYERDAVTSLAPSELAFLGDRADMSQVQRAEAGEEIDGIEDVCGHVGDRSIARWPDFSSFRLQTRAAPS